MSSRATASATCMPAHAGFVFWQPPAARSVLVGADATAIPLPQIPLPLPSSALGDGEPSDTAVGSGIYDYLRQFPDCPHNTAYAALLRDAWPHYLADLAAQAIMLDHKVVDAPYIQRKIASLKILLLLGPDNAGLLLQLGMACHDLAMMFSELVSCRRHLLQAMSYFSRVQKLQPGEPASLSHLAQIDFLIGDYPSASQRWQTLLPLLNDEAARKAVRTRLERIDHEDLPDQPLVDALEAIGEAMRLLANDAPDDARLILEGLESSGLVLREFPTPEFYCLLAAARERTGDNDAARLAFLRALEIDPEHADARTGFDQLLAGGTP